MTISGTAGTWLASTCRSGSAMVIKAPIKNTRGMMGHTERLPIRTTSPPTPSPMGIMAMSAPREKSPIPTTRRMAPSRNIIRVPAGISGARVKLSTSTMAVMGITEESDSRVFAFRFFRIHTLRFRFIVFVSLNQSIPLTRENCPRSGQFKMKQSSCISISERSRQNQGKLRENSEKLRKLRKSKKSEHDCVRSIVP